MANMAKYYFAILAKKVFLPALGTIPFYLSGNVKDNNTKTLNKPIHLNGVVGMAFELYKGNGDFFSDCTFKPRRLNYDRTRN